MMKFFKPKPNSRFFSFQPSFSVMSCLLLLFAFVGLTSCFTVSYSTSGASISPEVKTVSVLYFPNRASNVLPSLSQDITEKLREKIRSNTSLTMVVEGGDANFEGEITGYTFSPIAIQGNDKAAKNRMTVTIRVKYTNTVDPKFNYDASFSRYRDYESDKMPDQVSGELIPLIIDELTEDIFNKAFVNW